MASKKTKAPTGETSKKNVRGREKALGTPKGQRQSATAIKKRAQGERGAKKRVSIIAKGNAKLQGMKGAAMKTAKGRKAFKSASSSLRKGMAKAARLSKTAASGAG